MGFISSLFGGGAGVRKIAPAEAAQLVAAGTAVLIDVREPSEWRETGVAKPALLISLGSLKGAEGLKQLEPHKAKELIFYCRSGGRSGMAASHAAGQGFRTANAGGFSDWAAAGLPVRTVD
jgi:rhodanese-related sulfurtransferase